MTKTKHSRSIFRDLFFLALLITPLAGVAVFLWGVKVKDQLSALRESHTLAHKAVEGFIERDIDDLESQLENSIEKGTTFLAGDFRFRKEGQALRATHTSRPTQPLLIGLEGEMAFAKPLNQFKTQSFVLVTAASEIISHSNNARKEAFGSVADPKIFNSETSRALSLSGFDQSRVKPLSTSQFLLERPHHIFTRTTIAKSNLVLFSYNGLLPLWKQATTSLALILLASFAALMLGVAAIFALRSRQARNHAWVHDVFESLRFGRLDTGLSAEAHDIQNTEFYAKVQESLGKNTSLRRFLESDWIDASKSSVSWNFFKHSIAHWGEGLSTESTDAPSRWYLGSCQVRSPEYVENFQRSFTRVFGKRRVRIYQSGENTFSFTLRDLDVASCLAKLKEVLRSTSAGAQLNTSDVSMSVVLISENIPGKSLEALAATQQRCTDNFSRGLNLLIESCVELRHYQTGTELSIFGISDALEAEFLENPLSTGVQGQETPSPTKFPKRSPIVKRPVKQTPATSLSSKNMRAGKGFIRITDALGKSEWVEISSKDGPKPAETKEIAK